MLRIDLIAFEHRSVRMACSTRRFAVAPPSVSVYRPLVLAFVYATLHAANPPHCSSAMASGRSTLFVAISPIFAQRTMTTTSNSRCSNSHIRYHPPPPPPSPPRYQLVSRQANFKTIAIALNAPYSASSVSCLLGRDRANLSTRCRSAYMVQSSANTNINFIARASSSESVPRNLACFSTCRTCNASAEI
jgi:hypothetical protein